MDHKNKLNNWAKVAGAKTTMSILLGVVLFSASCTKDTSSADTSSDDTTSTELQAFLTKVGEWKDVKDFSDFKKLVKAEVIDKSGNGKSLGATPHNSIGYVAGEFNGKILKCLIYKKDGAKNQGAVVAITGALKTAVGAGKLFKERDRYKSTANYYSSASIQFIKHALAFIKTLNGDEFKHAKDRATVDAKYAEAKASFESEMEKVTHVYKIYGDAADKELKEESVPRPKENDIDPEVIKVKDSMLAEVQKAYDEYVNTFE